MEHCLVNQEDGCRQFRLKFSSDEELKAALVLFSQKVFLSTSRFKGRGELKNAVIASGRRKREGSEHVDMDLPAHLHVLNFSGEIITAGKSPRVKARLVASKADGSVCSGHLIKGWVGTRFEVLLSEIPRYQQRSVLDKSPSLLS